jgi:hypothetical protein
MFSGTKSKSHALIVFFQMIIDFGGNNSSEIVFGKRVIFVKSFAVKGLAGEMQKNEIAAYISPTELAISVHSKSTWPSSCFKANDLNSGSGSDNKPTKPAAETSPTILVGRHVKNGQ